jgi:radical SAM protein with 4Fe4S-binding SPASM domain
MEKLFDNQFKYAGVQVIPKQKQTVYVVVAKPTRFCNADCSYCSSPPLTSNGIKNGEPFWDLETFKKYFDKVYPYMANGAVWIWHGGEPMLMGVEFYKKTYEYAIEKMKETGRIIHFSMQSNLLAYNKQWKEVFENIFNGSISSSFDPDELNRTVKGNAESYSRLFKRALTKILDDGFRPMVIGVYNEETAFLMDKMYDWSLSLGEKSFPLRFNYCHPSGRLEQGGEVISPITYANRLISIYNRWIKDVPDFTITPLDQMFKKVIGLDGEGHCPWTRKCGGRFIEIEPNGEIYNCSEFADTGKEYCFGSLNDETVTLNDMLSTTPALKIKRRVTNLPNSCETCEHFDDCEGGCMRDAMLYNHGLYGKFHYCESWKMVFTRIKESILSGEADNILIKYELNPEHIKNYVMQNLKNHFDFTQQEIDSIIKNGTKNKFGFGDNFEFIEKSNYSKKGEFLLTDSNKSNLIKNDNLLEKSINKSLKLIKIKIIS